MSNFYGETEDHFSLLIMDRKELFKRYLCIDRKQEASLRITDRGLDVKRIQPIREELLQLAWEIEEDVARIKTDNPVNFYYEMVLRHKLLPVLLDMIVDYNYLTEEQTSCFREQITQSA